MTLESLAFGGDAVGHIAGKVIFIPFGAPGDYARVRIIKETASYCRGEIVELLTAGIGRRPPLCPYFGTCGGCQWQHLDYEHQVLNKREIYSRAINEIHCRELLPLTKSPREFGYRRRTRMHWENTEKELCLGYFRGRSKILLNISQCPLLVDSLQKGIEHCRPILQKLPCSRGTLVGLTSATGEVHISIRIESGQWIESEQMWSELIGLPIIGGQIQSGSKVIQIGKASVDLNPTSSPSLYGSAMAFAQANSEQEQLLRHRVAQWAEVDNARVLEIFAGIGNLTTQLTKGSSEVVAVESSPESAKLLQKNSANMDGLVQVIAQDAEDTLQQLVRHQEQFDVVVLDPPREGCAAILPYVARLHVKRLVYVSCDPMTLARDAMLLRKLGFNPLMTQAQDMMPQTFHIESITLFENTAQ